MTLRRAVLYVGGASLLIAWLSSAASVSLQRAGVSTAADRGGADSAGDALAVDVQQQAKRLRQRLASAPLPQQPSRNPFAFRVVRRQQEPAVVSMASVPKPVPELPSEPALVLVGIAEQKGTDGIVRTAMIETAADDLLLAKVGDTVVQRYKLTAIGHDTVELTDLTTGQLRRISMQ